MIALTSAKSTFTSPGTCKHEGTHIPCAPRLSNHRAPPLFLRTLPKAQTLRPQFKSYLELLHNASLKPICHRDLV